MKPFHYVSCTWLWMLVVCAALSGLAGATWANDTALSVQGGLASAMAQHPSIRMVSAQISADLYHGYSRVECDYVFRNDGAATTVSMGFPSLPGYGDIPDQQVAPALEDFRSWVDGAEVTTRQLAEAPTRKEGGRRWYVKEVPFAAGQERKVRDTYRQPNGVVATGEEFFPYVLSTGASWHDTIGDLQVRLTWRENWDWAPMPERSENVKWQRQPNANEFRWSAKNIDPDFDLRFDFVPGWQYVDVDGYHAYDAGVHVRVTPTEVYLAAQPLAELLPATLSYDAPSRTATFQLSGGRRFEFTAGVAGGAYEQDDQMWVPAGGLLHALGWQVTADRESHTLRILTGRPVAWDAQVQGYTRSDGPEPLMLARQNGVLMAQVRDLQDDLESVTGQVMTPRSAEPVLSYQVTHEGHDFRFVWGRTRAWSDGRFVDLPAAPYISAVGSGMAPVEAVCAALGLTCTYDEAKKLLTVRQKPVNP